MSKTTQALVLKLLLTFVASWIAFGFIDENNLANIFVLAIIGTILNYLLGDLFVLPKYGNLAASLGDGLLAALTAYIYSMITNFDISTASLILFFALIAVGEYYFHKYLLGTEKVEPNE